jgi:molybdopterin synthase sulfur carrier subunit
MAKVTIRYWAAAREAAGIPEESVEAVSLAGALDAAIARRTASSRLREIFARSSFLVDANPVGRAVQESIMLDDGAVIEVLPPFAGG